jgi:uncharacterized circularly permuted ATP-grasp superfamily protein/uncharacterized alpha-E superfamily protein
MISTRACAGIFLRRAKLPEEPFVKKEKTQRSEAEAQAWRYVPVEGQWDEAFRPSGFPRHAWRKLAVAIRHMGLGELTRRWETGRQLIEANGVTYNVYGDPQGKERPWLLDPIPFVVDDGEWAYIERSIVQRATLLNAVLADLYGPQRLIRERHLPAGLLFSNPNFLRPCAGIKPPDGIHLHTYAVDLARSPDGTWWAISDRTQSPSGMGYALENRLVSARTLPQVFNECRVKPLNVFFDVRRAALQRMGLRRSANPRVVVLTPGPHNETYFEHSFLAHHWGFPLVEGADLTIRDDQVYLKTLGGLERVDVIMRRMDDSFCDPLEFRGDSLLGIPGLTQAARSGNVVVANSLGSGLAETPAQMAFLPRLCETLLGESLQMPSVATWWCGQEVERRYVAEHLENLVIKPAHWTPGRHPEFPSSMSVAQRLDLLRRIEAKPEEFVAQEEVALSTAPTRTDMGLAPRHVVLRVFAVWDGDSYSVMPGGLTRVSTGGSSLVVSMQMGGGSKDTWILGGEAEVHRPPAPQVQGLPTELPSRVADNLFWLGRYSERVEAGVRLVRALLPSLSGEEDFGRTATLDTSVHLLGNLGYLSDEFPAMALAQQRWHVESLLSKMVYDPARLSGIGWNLNNVRRVAWPLKERLSSDTWRVLQQLETELSTSAPIAREYRLVAQMNLLDRVIVTLAAFAGLLMENATRGHGWRFLQIGKRLERGLQTTDLLQATFSEAPVDINPLLQTLLQAMDSSITYRSRYFTDLRPEFALELLMNDPGNPRSLRFQLEALLEHLGQLPGYDVSPEQLEGAPLPLMLAQSALGRVDEASIEDLVTRDEKGMMSGMGDLARQLKGTLYDISDALSARHFSHLTTSRLGSGL